MNIVYFTDGELAILKNIVASQITHNLRILKDETEDKAYFWQRSNPNDNTYVSKNSYECFKTSRNRQSKLKKHIAKLNSIQVSLKTPLAYPLITNGYSI